MVAATQTRPWHLEPGETTEDYQQFVAYLAMGPRRTVAAVARACGLHVRGVQRRANRHAWADRARAYDQAMAERELGELEDVRDQVRERLLGEAPAFVSTIVQCARGEYPCDKPALALQAAIRGLELCGFVPPRRQDPVERDDRREAARATIRGLSGSQLTRIAKVLAGPQKK